MDALRDRIQKERQLLCDTLTNLFQRQCELENAPVLKQSLDIYDMGWSLQKEQRRMEYEHRLQLLQRRMKMWNRRLMVLERMLEVLEMPFSALGAYQARLEKQYYVADTDASIRQRADYETIQMRLKMNI